MYMYRMYRILQRGINSLHQPGEHPLVDGLGEGVPGITSLLHSEWGEDLVSLGLDGAVGQTHLQLLVRDLQQLEY